jgi:hypothetical protein
VPIRSPEAIRGKALHLYKDADLRREMGKLRYEECSRLEDGTLMTILCPRLTQPRYASEMFATMTQAADL